MRGLYDFPNSGNDLTRNKALTGTNKIAQTRMPCNQINSAITEYVIGAKLTNTTSINITSPARKTPIAFKCNVFLLIMSW